MLSRLSKSLFILPLLGTVNSYAVELIDGVYASGFVAVGSANFRTFDHDPSEWEREWHSLTEAGVTLSANLPFGLEFNGQGLYRDAGPLSDGSEGKIDYASIDWRNAALGFGEQTISIGRVKSGGGIYNHTRDVPFTRPSIILPNSVYAEDFRSVYAHIDGIRLASDFYIGSGDLRVELAAGKPDLGNDFIGNIYSSAVDAQWQQDGALYFDMRYQNNHWLFTYSRTEVNATLDGTMMFSSDDNAPQKYIGRSELSLDSHAFGLQYSERDFQATVEYSKQKLRGNNRAAVASINRDIEGYYGQFRYFITPELSLLARFEELQFDIKLGERNHSPIGLLNSEQYTLGLSWRMNANWQLNIEGHKNKTDYWDEDLTLVQLAWRF